MMGLPNNSLTKATECGLRMAGAVRPGHTHIVAAEVVYCTHPSGVHARAVKSACVGARDARGVWGIVDGGWGLGEECQAGLARKACTYTAGGSMREGGMRHADRAAL